MPTQPQRRPPPPVEVLDYSVDPSAVPLAAEIIGEQRLVLFKQQIAKGWKRTPTDAELEMMALVYQRLRYDPWARPPQLIFTLRWDTAAGGMVMTPQKTIDGLRLDASRSRDYLGQVGPQWCAEDGVWRDIWLREEHPAAARVGVLRRGFPEPLWSVALWREWVQKNDQGQPTSFWRDKPAHMLAKTAETMSLKRALPTETDAAELAHVQAMERLALSGNAAQHQRIFGTEDGGNQFDLPPGPSSQFVPLSARDAQDAPRALPPAAAAPPPGKRERPIGELYEEYGALLSRCVSSGAIPQGEVSKWVLPAGAERLLVVERGMALRAALNRHTIDQANLNMAAQQAGMEAEDDAPEPDEQLELVDEESSYEEAEEVTSMVLASQDDSGASLMVHTVTDAEYQRLSNAVEQAAAHDVDFDDCKVELPCAVTEIVRKRQVLEQRLEAVREAMAANPPPRAAARAR